MEVQYKQNQHVTILGGVSWADYSLQSADQTLSSQCKFRVHGLITHQPHDP